MDIKILDYEDLNIDERENVPDNGVGKLLANYLKVSHNGKVLLLESDAMEPEDSIFHRDLSWVGDAIFMAYKLGCNERRVHDEIMTYAELVG